MSRLLPDSNGRLPGGMQRRVFAFARTKLGRRGGSYFRYKLGRSEILIPLAHDLPLIRSHFPQYSTNIARLSVYVSEKYPDMCLIDIGANVGDTVAIVREHSDCAILCVEADEQYFNILSENLRRNQYQSVEAVRAFVASYTGELKGQLVADAGTAHFVEDSGTPINAVALSDLLRDFPEFQTPKLLKIDTDGFDCSILRSALEWLSTTRPVIFFEYDPFFFRGQSYDGTHIFEDLGRCGYTFAVIYDNYGDYITAVDLHLDKQILNDLQNYFLGRKGQRYADVAVFHGEDRDIGEHMRTKESEWALHHREER